jgi:mannose-6-phosphate isomerase
VNPIPLPPNQLRRTYAGGKAIVELRGGGDPGAGPEDWVGSTTTVFGEQRLGLASLADGTLLRDAIAAEPEAFLGAEHVAAFGTDPGLLVKLLDAGQRLPVHCHPDREFAQRHLHSRWGKTEAWLVVSTRVARPVVWIGFRQQIAPEVMREWVDTQDAQAMLHALNEVPVAAGDVIVVPAGVPHAIGEGMLICELQEPSDFGFLYEWKGYVVGPEPATMGLGWDRALAALDLAPWNNRRLEGLGVGARREAEPGGVTRLLGDRVSAFFSAERIRPDPVAEVAASFAILVVTDGGGELETAAGDRVELRRGETWLVPHAAGATRFRGRGLDVIRCLPPTLR